MANTQVDKSKDTKQGGTSTAGARSEKQAAQRNQEQANTGHDKGREVPRDGLHNVKSEPHWDPSEAPDESDAE